MGGGASSTINQEFNMSVVNDMLYDSVTNNTNISQSSMENLQYLTVKVDRNVGCNISTDQTITSSFRATTEQITDSFQNVQNDIINELQAQAGAALDKQTQMGNMQFGDRQNVNQTINSEIENIVRTQMETNNLTETINKSVNIQNQEVHIGETICFNGESLNFKQNISADLAAQAVAKNLISAISTNATATSIVQEGEATSATMAGGAAEVVEEVGEAATGILGAMTGPVKYAIIAAVICCLVIVIAMVMMGMSPAGQNKLRTANFSAMQFPGMMRR